MFLLGFYSAQAPRPVMMPRLETWSALQRADVRRARARVAGVVQRARAIDACDRSCSRANLVDTKRAPLGSVCRRRTRRHPDRKRPRARRDHAKRAVEWIC